MIAASACNLTIHPPRPATTYRYNLDRDLTKVTRPGGQMVDFGYDTGGRVSTVTIPGRALTYTYQATTGSSR